MARRDSRQAETKASEEIRLSRDLGPFTVTMMGVGGMIGAGIFALTGIAAGVAGPAVVLVFLLNGAVTLLTAFAYAELGSGFPRAGGGYVWIREGLGGANGFLAGWMSWFGYVVAGALYAIAFGGFATDAWQSAGLPLWGLAPGLFSAGFTVLAVLVFTGLNLGGSEETGAMGNVITVTKVAILGLFVIFGLLIMVHGGAEAGTARFVNDFMPFGIGGVAVGMGLTFIAFEGYEIIAQSGEEIIHPKRNVPRGIFWSIAIAVAIYVFVGIVAIGATTPPEGTTVYAFLGAQKELAVVSIARQIFPFGLGGPLMLVSGLAATMSALNVTLYSASRVSFAMGRDRNLPAVFARVHPRTLTPFAAVLATGGLMVAAGLLLPIATAATAGSMMFLLMFIQVNLAVIALRHSHPELDRGFLVPWFPLPVVLAIAANAGLVLYMITYDPTAVWMAFGWIVAGLLAYYMYFERQEEIHKPRAVVHEEAVGKLGYTVLVPVRNEREAKVLGGFAAALAKARNGGVVAAHLLQVPRQLGLADGRHLLDSGRGYFEVMREAAKEREVGIHTLIMMTRRIPRAVAEIAGDRQADFLVLAWDGKSGRGRVFGRTTDPLFASPPADLAIVRSAERLKPKTRTILVPVSAGENSRLALELAADLGRIVAGRANARITVLHVVGTKTELEEGAEPLFKSLLEDLGYNQVETRVVQGSSVANTVIELAADFDMVIFGAGSESIFERMVANSIGKRILRNAHPTTVMVKGRQPALQSFLRRTILPSPQPRRN